jgi:ornithine carbamoyltransferase
MLDGFMVRIARSLKVLRAFDNQEGMSIANGMTQGVLPTQALAALIHL